MLPSCAHRRLAVNLKSYNQNEINFPIPDRAEANDEDGRATKDEDHGEFFDPDVDKRIMSHCEKPLRTTSDQNRRRSRNGLNLTARLSRRSMLRMISTCLCRAGSN